MRRQFVIASALLFSGCWAFDFGSSKDAGAIVDGPDAAVISDGGDNSDLTDGGSIASTCPNNDDAFRELLWKPVLGSKCITCHRTDGIAAGTRMAYVPESDPEWLTKNQDTFRRIAQLTADGNPLVVLKPTGQYSGGHGGGRVIEPGSSDEAALRVMVAYMRGEIQNCTLNIPTDGGTPQPDAGVVTSDAGTADVDGGSTNVGCPDDDTAFTNRLWKPILGGRCIACHQNGGLAGYTRMVLTPESDPQWLRKNEATFRNIAQVTENGVPLILLKPTGLYTYGHGGGTVVVPGSADHTTLKEFVDWVRGSNETCTWPNHPDAGPDTPDAGASTLDGGSGTPDGGSVTTTCPDNDALFRDTLWKPVIGTKCLGCHQSGGLAGGTRMVLSPESDPTWLTKNQAALRTVAQVTEYGESLVMLKPTGRHPNGHGGGRVIDPGSDDENALRTLVAWMRGETPGCVTPTTPMGSTACGQIDTPRLLRRLTHEEYRNTIADLLGVNATEVDSFPVDDAVDGFHNNAGALKISGVLADQYQTAAEEISSRAIVTQLPALLPCYAQSMTALQSNICASDFVRTWGMKTFRRPLTDAEFHRYGAIFKTVAAEEGFTEGIRWVIAAMLQSPNFLYRAEMGARQANGTFTLNGWELASELSYLFWQTMPDSTLLSAADSGTLLTSNGLLTQVNRLAADPRSTRAISRFFEDWLTLEKLSTVPRDPVMYASLSPAIRDAMRGELKRFVEDAAANGLSLTQILTARHSFMTDPLAQYYGVTPGAGTADADGYKRVDLTGTGYGGLLAMGGVVMTHSLPNSSSPIHRGKLVRERLLCQPIAPPPPGLVVTPPAVDPNQSTRNRYLQHESETRCAACHRLIDPIGFAFEHFDGDGRWRLTDGSAVIDDSGWIVGSRSTDGTFTGAFDLASHLAASSEVQQCWATMWARYGTGYEDSFAAACETASKITPNSSLLAARRALTETTPFQQRKGGLAELDAPLTNPTERVASDATIDPKVDAIVKYQQGSPWPTGACYDGSVTNLSQQNVDWEVTTEVTAHINNSWNCQYTITGTKVTFTGVQFNRTVTPGSTVTFGFCVDF